MRYEIRPEAPEHKPSSSKKEKRPSPEEREHEHADREALLEMIAMEGVDAEQALNIVSKYGEEPSKDVEKEIEASLSAFGLRMDDLEPVLRRKVSALYRAATETPEGENNGQNKEAIETALADSLMRKSLAKLDALTEVIGKEGEAEKKKESLREFMNSLSKVAELVSPEDEGSMEVWDTIFERYHKLVELRKQSSEEIKELYDEVFAEFEDLIEVHIYDKTVKRIRASKMTAYPDDLMRDLYGHTAEEVEELKAKNREQTVAFILKNKDREPSIELLEELHRLNNKGIVSKGLSKIRRTYKEQVLYSGIRMGTFGQDVPEELSYVLGRADWLIANNPNKVRYEVSVAKLHNDMLNMHPFLDRNGSTSMLFAEFMMAKKGYVPDPKREKSFYNYVRKSFGNNPIAFGVVGGGMYEIGKKSGYYEGMTARGKEEAYKDYFRALEEHYAE